MHIFAFLFSTLRVIKNAPNGAGSSVRGVKIKKLDIFLIINYII